MGKEPSGATYCENCGLPVSLGATNLRGEIAEDSHVLVPGQPTACPEQQ
ncbi:hypothetical protein [Streptomyces mirabilis]